MTVLYVRYLTAQLYLTIVSPYDGEMMAPNGRVVGLCHLKTWVGGVCDSNDLYQSKLLEQRGDENKR